jgi:hypothetical protein
MDSLMVPARGRPDRDRQPAQRGYGSHRGAAITRLTSPQSASPSRIVSAVALYGEKPAPVADLLSSVQLTLARRLGAAFEPYTMDQIHSTIVRLDAQRDKATGRPVNQAYLEHTGRSRAIDIDRAVETIMSHLDPPLVIRLGGHRPDGEPGLTSQGQRPYERMFSSIGGAFVLMGWPLISIETGGKLQPLDDLRRSMNDANVWHYYHQGRDDVENDFHLVVGHHTQAVTAEMVGAAVRDVRARLSEEVVDVPVGIEQVFIVAADSSTLAPARFVGRLPVSRDQLLDLYG